jgi:hypothetical protein
MFVLANCLKSRDLKRISQVMRTFGRNVEKSEMASQIVSVRGIGMGALGFDIGPGIFANHRLISATR